MDSDFESSMMLLRFLPGATAAVAVILIPLVMFGPMVLYIIARWRAHRAGTVDPQLGIKFAMHLFATSALYVVLAGAAILVFTVIGPGPSSAKGEMYRVAFALMVPAGIVLGVHLMMIKRTNDQEMPSVRRLFLGYNLIVIGSMGFFSLLFAFQMLFAKGNTHGMGHLAGSLVVVYCTAWGVLGWKLSQLVFSDWGGSSGLPEAVVPPQHQMPPPAAAAGGGTALPPLGGGSYPPIEPR